MAPANGIVVDTVNGATSSTPNTGISSTAVVLIEPGTQIRAEDLALAESGAGERPSSMSSTGSEVEESYHLARDRVIAQFERQYLTWLVSRAGGNMSRAARIAGVDRTTLYRLMERHGLQRSPGAGGSSRHRTGA